MTSTSRPVADQFKKVVAGRMTDSGGPPALHVEGLAKTFGGVRALKGVDLTVEQGEVHALLGENGSGKSTLIKILSGYHQPDEGALVAIDGAKITFGSAQSAYTHGCRFVHQDLGLVGTSSVLDNICLNAGFPSRFGTINTREAMRSVREDLARVGLDQVDPRTPVALLTSALKTGVAVARALRTDANHPVRLLVLDEPTATLPETEVKHLLEIVRRVAVTGVGVLYVTHRLDEVFEVADTVTVFRDGLRVATQPTSTLNRRSLINLLIGSELDEIRSESEQLQSERGDSILRVTDLVAGPIAGVSLDVRPGDVLGIAGITGSGRESLLATIFGAHPREGGTIEVNGRELVPHRPDLAMANGLAYLPPDRKIQGGIMEFTARENIVISDLKPFWRGLRLHGREEVKETRSWFDRLGVRPESGVNLRLSAFSGGNQQKVLFGKWLRRTPLVFLLDEPTQGVDVGAKAELHRQLLAAAAAGAGLVVATTDLDELVALCHRVLVLRDGRVVAHLVGEAVTMATVARESLGAEGKVVAA